MVVETKKVVKDDRQLAIVRKMRALTKYLVRNLDGCLENSTIVTRDELHSRVCYNINRKLAKHMTDFSEEIPAILSHAKVGEIGSFVVINLDENNVMYLIYSERFVWIITLDGKKLNLEVFLSMVLPTCISRLNEKI